MDEKNILRIQFDSTPLPEFEEKKNIGKDWVFWGEKNDFPDYLLTLFENSTYHNAIITGKVHYIKGSGFEANFDGLDEAGIANLTVLCDGINEYLEEVINDLEIYGGFAIEVIWDLLGEKIAETAYIDIANLRTDQDNTLFYYSNDWKASRQSEDKTGFRELFPFDETNRKGKQVLYYVEPRKKAKHYPKPGYVGGLKPIATDAEISNFHYHSIINGFVGGTIINFNNGAPATKEEEIQIEKKIKRKHSGTDNANGIVITFSDDKDKAPTVLNLNGNDFDKRFDLLDKSTQQKIFTVHKVVSPMLFGIKTEGQLGGREEISEAYELFKNVYVNNKQQKIEAVFNGLAKINGFDDRLSIIPTEPINQQIDENILATVLTPDEIREKAGLPKIQQPAAALPVKNAEFTITDKEVEVFSQYGRPKIGYEVFSSKEVNFKSIDDAVSSEIAIFRDRFKKKLDIDETGKKILAMIRKDNLIEPSVISKVLKQPLDKVVSTINDLKDQGLITGEVGKGADVTSDGGKALENNPPDTEVEVLYEYAEKAGIPPVITESRSFCKEMLKLDKYYSREDIEHISEILGRDVWRERGGWYHNPKTDVTTPSCRHVWKQQIVKKNG